jgi:hypothetical protein
MASVNVVYFVQAITQNPTSIFAPQETGYTRPTEGGKNEMPLNIIQTLPKLIGGEK